MCVIYDVSGFMRKICLFSISFHKFSIHLQHIDLFEDDQSI